MKKLSFIFHYCTFDKANLQNIISYNIEMYLLE